MRKISIFGRKASGQSSEALHRPLGNTTPEQARLRARKSLRSDMFHSSDSLHDGHSTADQHTDDEHGKELLDFTKTGLIPSEKKPYIRRKPIAFDRVLTNTFRKAVISRDQLHDLRDIRHWF